MHIGMKITMTNVNSNTNKILFPTFMTEKKLMQNKLSWAVSIELWLYHIKSVEDNDNLIHLHKNMNWKNIEA